MVVSNVLYVASAARRAAPPIMRSTMQLCHARSRSRPRPRRARRSSDRRGSILTSNHLTMAALLVTFFVGEYNNWAKPPARPDYDQSQSYVGNE